MMYGRKILLCIVSVIALVYSCNKPVVTDAIVARVGDKELAWSQLQSLIPDNSTAEDSSMLAQNYINNWIREQVVIVQAEQNLSEDKKNFDDLIENYRKSLLTYAFEEELISQKLDTIIVEEEIVNYYNDHIGNFELKDFIVKVKFCAINSESKQIKNLKKLFYSAKTEDIVRWEQFCVDNDASYYFSEDKWLTFEELLKQVPLNANDPEDFLKRNKSVEFEHEGNLYLLLITEYQLSGSVSPLEFERTKIRNLILNKRKLELVTQMREDLYNEAIQQKQIEIFTNQK